MSDFKILPDDREFVEKIAALIPLEVADRESLTTLIAAHRTMHSAASPQAACERELALAVRKLLAANRVIHNLVSQLGGTAVVKDSDIPFDWSLSLDPSAAAQTLTIVASRCEQPVRP